MGIFQLARGINGILRQRFSTTDPEPPTSLRYNDDEWDIFITCLPEPSHVRRAFRPETAYEWSLI
ncbi:hypothetical protein MJO28_013593 [Puccinia striiformis f. sp. tritici]|uniref:Uncharacterized protein n=2 Tax=Puccinia striiformis f. sp. tritici TaxID=168172 RepID=A0ACC0DV23_9BASI|nr:hypothetical protein MJO28_013593 [Puccinia striiformis f. sp. tritici]